MPSAPDPARVELDASTLARAQRGERVACTRFVGVYQRRVFAAIGRMLGSRGAPARVEELAQDTFVRALGALPRFSADGPAKLSTWVLTIATRVALNELRRSELEVVPLSGSIDRAAPDEAERLLDRQALQTAIDGLTPEQRAVIVLHDLHGMTDGEVAEALELGVTAVKSRLHRARVQLRKALRAGREEMGRHDD